MFERVRDCGRLLDQLREHLLDQLRNRRRYIPRARYADRSGTHATRLLRFIKQVFSKQRVQIADREPVDTNLFC